MDAICCALLGMKNKLDNAALMLPLIMTLAFYIVRAQQTTTYHTSDFTEVEYFEPPHQQLMKSRLSCAEAQPQADGLVAIKQFKLEMFDTNGVLEMVVKAPDCVYDTQHGVASSAGHLRLETANASSHVEGDGFLWRQSNQFLTISDNVQTVIEATPRQKIGP
jgi:hypothetical protein